LAVAPGGGALGIRADVVADDDVSRRIAEHLYAVPRVAGDDVAVAERRAADDIARRSEIDARSVRGDRRAVGLQTDPVPYEPSGATALREDARTRKTAHAETLNHHVARLNDQPIRPGWQCGSAKKDLR
jgi:hypothetical protein